MLAKHLFAAVDLGSNSFRLEIGQLEAGRLRRVEYLKETVRQGNGLDAERLLSDAALQRGWDCLARFGERLAGFKPAHVRAVATQTLREAKNRDVFIARAQKILGFPIEVIAGTEEARLIYLGVSHMLPPSDERRLVVDIGGRSTELILGQHMQPLAMESYRIGSVAWSMKYFRDGSWSQSSFEAAEIAAQAILDEALSVFQTGQWDRAYGSSGTVGAVADALAAHGWPEGLITREGLDWLKERLIKAERPENLRLDGFREDRRPVIGGGLSVLCAVFDLLQIEVLHVAQGALRHGALFDMLDRETPQADVRTAMVQGLARRFSVDPLQATRVSERACGFMQALMPEDLPPESRERLLQTLQWAGQLHEIGMLIAHSDHHKHGAYVLKNSDLTGFTLNELQSLGDLVLGHRGKLKKLDGQWHQGERGLMLLSLRLAVMVCHARRNPDVSEWLLRYEPSTSRVRITLPRTWCDQWPQSNHLLREECLAWSKTQLPLELDIT